MGVDGKTYTLSSFKDARVLVIVFTCNHCPTAQAYEDRIIQLTKDYSGRGVDVVAIMPNDPSSIRLDELGYTDMGDSFDEMKRRAAEKHARTHCRYRTECSKCGPCSSCRAGPRWRRWSRRIRGKFSRSRSLASVTRHAEPIASPCHGAAAADHHI